MTQCKQWKKKLISMITVAMLAVTCIPAAMLFAQEEVHAIGATDKYIHLQDGKLLMNDGSAVKLKGISAKGNTITLNNFSYEGVYFGITTDSNDVTFVLKGKNTITALGDQTGLHTASAIMANGGVTVKGNGTLTLATKDSASSTGLFSYKDIKITDGAKVYIKSDGGKYEADSAFGISTRQGTYSQGTDTFVQVEVPGGGIGLRASKIDLPKETKMRYKVGKAYSGIAKVGKYNVPGMQENYAALVEKDGKTISNNLQITVGKGGSTPEPTPDPKPGKITAPKTINAKALDKSTIRVAWSKVSKATQYLVYVSTSKTGTYTLLDTVKNTALKADGLAANKTYYFKVKAKGSAGTSGYSKVASAKTGSTSTNPGTCPCGNDHSKAWFKLKQINSSQITVTWTPQKGAKLYQVANNHTSKKNMKIKWTGNNSQKRYLSIGKSKGKNYQYKMRTVKYQNGKRVYGSWSSKVCITMK